MKFTNGPKGLILMKDVYFIIKPIKITVPAMIESQRWNPDITNNSPILPTIIPKTT